MTDFDSIDPGRVTAGERRIDQAQEFGLPNSIAPAVGRGAVSERRLELPRDFSHMALNPERKSEGVQCVAASPVVARDRVRRVRSGPACPKVYRTRIARNDHRMRPEPLHYRMIRDGRAQRSWCEPDAEMVRLHGRKTQDVTLPRLSGADTIQLHRATI